NSYSLNFGATTLYNSGSGDFFIAKYDSSGNVLWAKSSTGIGDELGFKITTDISGNIYVTGLYTSTVTFGNTTLMNSGAEDIFIVKYDASGNMLWAKSAGGSGNDNAEGTTTD